MNVTPLIDVLLVLIIIFMVIVAESKEKGLEAQIPQPSSETVSPIVRTIVIQLAEPKSGEFPILKINQEELAWPDLKAKLQDIFKQRAERVAFVQGDDNCGLRVRCRRH